MVSKEIIEEAAKRGIVPGARIRDSEGREGVVDPVEYWEFGEIGSVYCNSILRAISFDGKYATVITPAPSSDTLKPGMATACGPAMRAAIMERAKELGLMHPFSSEEYITEGIWVLDFGFQKGMLHTCTFSNSEGLKSIPTHEFLRLMENTKPPKKELTAEELLAEAVRLLDRVTTGHENLMKACGHYTTPEDFTHTGAARAFLKALLSK